MKFSGKVWSDHGATWLHFGSIRVNGSIFCYHRPQLRGLALPSQYHSLGGSRGRGLLCLAPQLVNILQPLLTTPNLNDGNDVTGNLHVVTIWYAASKVTQKIFCCFSLSKVITSSLHGVLNCEVFLHLYQLSSPLFVGTTDCVQRRSSPVFIGVRGACTYRSLSPWRGLDIGGATTWIIIGQVETLPIRSRFQCTVARPCTKFLLASLKRVFYRSKRYTGSVSSKKLSYRHSPEQSRLFFWKKTISFGFSHSKQRYGPILGANVL